MRITRQLLFVVVAIGLVALCSVGIVWGWPLVFGKHEGIPVEGVFICEQTGHKWEGTAYKVNEYDPYVYSKWTKSRTARQAVKCATCGEWVLPPIPKPYKAFSEMRKEDLRALTEMTEEQYAAWQEEAEAKPFSEMTQAEVKALSEMTPAEYAAWQSEAEAKAFREMTAAEYNAWQLEADDMLADAICPKCAGPMSPRKMTVADRSKIRKGRQVVSTRQYHSGRIPIVPAGRSRYGSKTVRRRTTGRKPLPRVGEGLPRRQWGTSAREIPPAEKQGETESARSEPYKRSSRKKVPEFDEFFAYRTQPYDYYSWGVPARSSDVYSRTDLYAWWGDPPLRDMFYRTTPYYRRGRKENYFRSPGSRPFERGRRGGRWD